jgi:hypothetical protein
LPLAKKLHTGAVAAAAATGPHAAATTLTIQDPTPPEGPEQTFESMGAKFALDMEGYEAEGDVEMLLEMMTPDSTPVAPAPVAHHCTCPPNELRTPCSLSTSFQVLSIDYCSYQADHLRAWRAVLLFSFSFWRAVRTAACASVRQVDS